MPNWCNNSIEITGPLDKIKALYNEAVQDADDETGLLNHMMPMPVELHDTTSPSEDGEDWYSWRVSNWGTKWEVSSEGLEFYDNRDGTGTVSGWFDSAWAPPIGAYDFYLENNPDCSINASYEEPGMDFAGIYDNGDDQYCEDIHTEVMDVLTFDKKLEETSDLFQKLNEEFDFVNNRADWYEMDDINEARAERELPELTEEEYRELTDAEEA